MSWSYAKNTMPAAEALRAGYGSPEGVLDAEFNELYVDLSTPALYRKGTQRGTITGWTPIAGGEATTPATTDAPGIVELATIAESEAGTDTARASTPAGVAAAIAALAPGGGGAVPNTIYCGSGQTHTTLAAAKAAATSGQRVRVLAGTYTLTNETLAKDGVTWDFDPGAIVNATYNLSSNNRAVFDDMDGALTCNVLGYAQFNVTATTGTVNHPDATPQGGGCLRLWANSSVTFECDSITLAGSTGSYGGQVNARAILQRDGTMSVLVRKGITCTGLAEAFSWCGGRHTVSLGRVLSEVDAVNFSRSLTSSYPKAHVVLDYVYGKEHSIRVVNSATDGLTDISVLANHVDGFVLTTSHLIHPFSFLLRANKITEQMHLYGTHARSFVNIDTDRHEAKDGHLFAQFNTNVRYSAREMQRTTTHSVRCRTTANVNLSGGGIAHGTTHDGVTVATGDLILVASQTTASQNGIYVVPASGAASRATTADSWDEIYEKQVTIQSGTTFGNTYWRPTVNVGGTIGSTDITGEAFVPSYTAFRVHRGTSVIQNTRIGEMGADQPAILVPADQGVTNLTLENVSATNTGLDNQPDIYRGFTFTVDGAASAGGDTCTCSFEDAEGVKTFTFTSSSGAESAEDIASDLSGQIDAEANYTASVNGAVITVVATNTGGWVTAPSSSGEIGATVSGVQDYEGGRFRGSVDCEGTNVTVINMRNCDFRCPTGSAVGAYIPSQVTLNHALCTGDGSGNSLDTAGSGTINNGNPY